MKCETTYLYNDIRKIVVVIKFIKDRDDDPDTWDIIPRIAWARVTSPTLRSEHDLIESEPFTTVEEGRAWEAKQLKEIKQKIETYRMSKSNEWVQGRSFLEITKNMMDTVIRVTVFADDRTRAETAVAAVFARMQQVSDAASIFDCNAEAFRLNHDGFIDNPSADLFKLFQASLDYNRISKGYFDITIQPLLEIWSAGLWKDKPEAQKSKIHETMQLIGFDKISINARRISFLVKGMKVTFGAIAKGYAVETALETLGDLGVQHARIAAGGEIGTLGTRPDGQPWIIDLVNPQNVDQTLVTFQWEADRSISTSGNYERYFSDNKTVNHLINPKTGYSAADCISVTIIAPTNTKTDALATSVFAMGPETGLDLIKSLKNVDCLIIDNNKKIISSPGIDQYLVKK
ncbi:FAD:protein FMN transferase [Chloroflexota bacterium]